MKTQTTTKIILDARRLIDGETSDVTVDLEPDSELLSYLNDAYAEFVDLVIDAGGTDLLATYVDLPEPYDLDGVYRDLALSKDQGNGEFVDLRRFNFHERHKYVSTDFPAWRIMGGVLRLFPTDADPGTLRLWYIPDATAFLEGENVPVFGGWDTYLSALIAHRCLTKEQRHSEEVEQLMTRSAARVRKACQNLNTATPDHVADVHRVAEDYYDVGSHLIERLPRP